MSIQVKNITKMFGSFKALNDVTLDVPSGGLVALLGPSGSGKTTLLRVIAGLEQPDSGTVLFNGEDARERKAKERGVGFVFQHYALFRHMTVFENVAFGLRVRPKETRPGKAEIYEKVFELLKLVHIDSLYNRYPSELSGGQRQRVALARALAVEPKVLLLDEPFGALDAKVRKELRRWMRHLHDEIHVTSVFVTHDQEEAFEVADMVVIMNEGRVEQIGKPEEVYHLPANAFVYDFIGNINLLKGYVKKDGEIEIARSGKEMPGKSLVTVYVRPHHVEIYKKPPESLNQAELYHASVTHTNPAGPIVKVELVVENTLIMEDKGDVHTIQAEISQEDYYRLDLERKDEVFIRFREMRVISDETGKAHNWQI